MTKGQAGMRGDKSDFTEEQRPTSGFRSPQKRRKVIIAAVVTIIVFAVIIAIVVPVVVNRTGKDSESQKSGCMFACKGENGLNNAASQDHWCGLMLPAGVNMSEVEGPTLIGGRKTCDITGTCWKKEQCYTCFEGPNRDRVGNINDIPVCCPNCERHGLIMSWNTCDCRNGDSY